MLVGVPKEIKPQENRVGLVPSSVGEIVFQRRLSLAVAHDAASGAQGAKFAGALRP